MKTQLLFLAGLLLMGQAFAETKPVARPTASRLAAATSTYTTIASSLNPSTVGTSVTFTSTTKYQDFFFDALVTEGTVTFSEGATVLAADVPVAAGLASFSTTALTAGTHVITAVYNGTANYATSTGFIVQTVDDPDSCPTYTGNIAYVNASATPGTNDGTTWARAFLTLQAALDAARTCGVTQIWVAQGTYVPTNYPIGAASGQYGGGLTSADFSFHLVNGVAIYGGFSGSETQLSQRNWRQNPTILSGSNARYHVVTSANDDLSTRLDGFTITGGRANGNTQLRVEGQFLNATTGAGVSLLGSSVTLSNLLISGNSCPSTDFGGGSGGGMAMQGGSSVLTNVAFVGNSAYSGGGLTASSTFTMTNCVFSGNTANAGGGGMTTGGYQNASATLTNVVFANNAATRSGDFPATGGAMINNGAVTTLVNCTFFGNTATGTGGTMYSVNGATVNDKNGIYYNNSNNGNTAYNGVLNYTASGPFKDTFNATTTLTGTDPKFVNAADPDGPDNVWMTADDGLSIASDSPAINAGTAAGAPATDIRGFARTGNPDQGAYEYTACVTPTAFAVTGGGGYCAGGSGVAIGLSGSESGVSYQLKRDGNNVGATVGGNGSPLSFGNQTAAGTYTVLASRSETCTATMTGSASVSINPLPVVSITGLAASYCKNAASVTLSGSPAGGSFTIDNQAATTFDPASLSVGPHSVGYSYTDGNGCTGVASPVSVTVNPAPSLSSVAASPNPVCEASLLTLTATASGGTGSLSYAWSGPNAYSASTNPATRTVGLTDGGVYSVIVKDENNCQTSGQTAPVVVSPKTTIQSVTPSQSICSNLPFQVSVTASGQNLTYQWYRKVGASLLQPIPGATSATSTIPVAYLPGSYYVVVKGACGKDSSQLFSLSPKAPTILQVSSLVNVVCEGANLTLSVRGQGPGSLSYAWRKGDASGAVVGTGSSFTITNAQVGDAGTYSCTLTSECTSQTVSISVVVQYLRITTQPQSVNLCSGNTTLSVGVQAVGLTPTYQWKKNGASISGATQSSYTVLSSRPGTYSVEVRTTCVTLLSQGAVVGCGTSRLALEAVGEPRLSVAPNPASGQEIRCHVVSMENPEFGLTSLSGRKLGVKSSGGEGGEYLVRPTERLGAGVYILQASEGKTRLSQRVLILE